MNEFKLKRARLPNFTVAEESLLLELAEQRMHVIENKNPDSHTWEKKRRAWNEINDALTKKFGLSRGAKNIREKYENLKRKQKRNCPEEFYESSVSQYKRKDKENLKKRSLQQQQHIEKKLAAIICYSGNANSNDAYNDVALKHESDYKLYTENDDTTQSVNLEDPIKGTLYVQENDNNPDILEAHENDSIHDSESQENFTGHAPEPRKNQESHVSEPQDKEYGQDTSSEAKEPPNYVVPSTKSTQKKNMKPNFETTFKNYSSTLCDANNSIYENRNFAVERYKREAEKHKWEVEKLQCEIRESKLRAKILQLKLEQSLQRSRSPSPASTTMSDTDEYPIETVSSQNISNKPKTHFPAEKEIKVEPDLDINDTSINIANEDHILPDALNAHKILTQCNTNPGSILNKRIRLVKNTDSEQQQWEVALKNDAPYITNNETEDEQLNRYVYWDTVIDYNNTDDEDADVSNIQQIQQNLLSSNAAQTNDESDECKFLKLLTKYKLQNYSVKLNEINIDLFCLKHIREEDIKDIFERDIGGRIRFRALVEDWRTSHMDFNAVFNQQFGNNSKEGDVITKKDIVELKSYIKNAQKTFIKEQQKTREQFQHATHEQAHQCNLENILKNHTYKEILPKKPFDSTLDFKNFEDSVLSCDEKYSSLICELTTQSGKDAVGFIKSCWRRIMTDNVAKNFCWIGKPDKPAIRELRVTSALREAYLRKYKNTSMEEFQRTIIAFFQHANARLQKKGNYEKLKAATLPV
ncbi:uncharacterized protein [Eurosta solidaginis]|uniref:uncharacterized protein n=1 Tax=Eurosta solidaginis TaxID=178769 RepID=UPI0035313C0B